MARCIFTVPQLPLWNLRLCFLVLTSFPFAAAPRDSPSSASTDEWLINTWENEDGPPEYTATAMVQTADGYLWFGTFGGLERFDGVKLTSFDPANTPQLPSSGIVNLHLDRRGWLWISTYRGLVVRQDTQWRAFGTNDGWAGDYVRTFAERANGDLLMTTFDGHVLEFSRGRLAPLPAPPGERGQGYLAHADEAGRWWVVQNRFIGQWDGERWVPMVTPGNVVADAVGCVTARDGGLWLLLGRELRKYRQGTEISRRQLAQGLGGFWSMTEDSRSNVWICTYDQGLCQIASDGRLYRWTAANGLSADGVRFVFEDGENNVWVGTTGGLTRFKPRRVRSFGKEHGLAAGVNSVCSDGAGGLWVGTYGTGLFRSSVAGITNVPLPGVPIAPTYLQSVLMDRAGRVWLGTMGDALRLVERQTVRSIPPEQTGGNNVIALFEDSRGRVWISGGGAGISFFDGKDFRCFGEKQGVARRPVFCFAEDARGAIWFSDDAGVFRLEQERFIEVRTVENQSVKGITCFKTDSSGALWLASRDRGLLRWRNGDWTRLDERAGVPRAAVHSIIEDDLGFWWLTSDLGIVRLAGTNLQAVADGKARSLEWQALDRSDGLSSLAFATGRQPASARDAQGRLWFATGKGLAMIDPHQFQRNAVPPGVHIERVTYRIRTRTANERNRGKPGPAEAEVNVAGPFSGPLRLPAGSHRLEIHYTSTSFSAPEKVRFQTRLQDQDADWQDTGTERVANFYELQPGDYTFRVRAANNDGLWNETGTSLAFGVEPFFWQTWWFSAGSIGLLVSAGGIMAWWQLRSRHRREVQQLERARRHEQELAHVSRVSILGELSASMAHELNQPLTAILTNAQAAQRFMAASAPDLAEFREILKDIAHDTTRARDVIRHLRALVRKSEPTFAPVDLAETIREVVGFLHGDIVARNVRVAMQLAPDLPIVHGDRIQIQQVMINLLLNAFDALGSYPVPERLVTVRADLASPEFLRVTVCDGGCGIPPDNLEGIFETFYTTKREGMGMGLSVSRTIIEAHGGRLWAENNAERGATLSFTIPVSKEP